MNSREAQFGELTVVNTFNVTKPIWRKWANCVCSCGNRVTVRYDCLQSGNNRSCGHILKTAKGLSQSRTYHSYTNMKSRCYNKSNNMYQYYGGRGIAVCDRWKKSFINFLEDMGECPSSIHSIDRVNNNGNYSPANCKWSTNEEQAQNTSRSVYYELNGNKMTIPQIAKIYGIKAKTLYTRVYSGKTIEEAIR